jgi:DNA repair exonuclease SbcCD ATPase subunit
MLNRVELRNFKKHEDLTIEFTGGLQLVKGRNEAGKSSIYEAVAYAMFGARALRMSLVDTVTDGKPTSACKVVLTFTLGGITYTLTRSGTGAELFPAPYGASGGGGRVVGQTEVTNAVERLFGCDADAASKLMLANQGELRGALEAGPTAAIALIEKLANLSLLDNLLEKASDKLVSGSTAQLEAELVSMFDLTEPDISETVAATSKFKNHQAVVNQCEAVYKQKEKEASVYDYSALKEHTKDLQRRISVEKTRLLLVDEMDAILKLPDVEEPNISGITNAMKADSELAVLKKQWHKFNAIDQPESVLTSHAEYEKKFEDTYLQKVRLTTAVADLVDKVASAKAMLIKDGECTVCGQKYSDLGIVKETNERVNNLIESLTAELISFKAELAETEAQEKMLQKVQTANVFNTQAVKDLPVLAVENTFPVNYVWVGKTDFPSGPAVDWAGLLKEAQAQAKEAATIKEKKRHAGAMLLKLHEQADGSVECLTVALEDNMKAVSEVDRLRAEAYEAKATLDKVKEVSQILKDAANKANADYAAAMALYELNVKQMEDKKELLQEMKSNNALIKKLRAARPVVAKKLWDIVLGSVSYHFSQIRGVPSTVTRGDNGFLVDGKPAKRLSGSTLDSLGLAIRVSLMKTFLPSVGWMMLDEPAAGMDDQRESDMVATVSSVGFDQVLLVSHSDAADSFAANLITI